MCIRWENEKNPAIQRDVLSDENICAYITDKMTETTGRKSSFFSTLNIDLHAVKW